MYFGDRDLAHPSPNFHRDQKVQNVASFKNHSILNRPRLKMQQDMRILKQKCNTAMIALCPGQVW